MRRRALAMVVAGALLSPSALTFGEQPVGTLLPSSEGRILRPSVAWRVLPAPHTLRQPRIEGPPVDAPSPAVLPPQEVIFAQTSVEERVSQLQQATTVLPGGGFGVVWNEGRYPSRDVRMQWLDRDGNLVFPPGGVSVAATSADESDAVIAAHPTSGAYVAFMVGPSSAYVRVQSFDASGAPRWPGMGVVAGVVGVTEWAASPHLVPNPAGGVFVCFEIGGSGFDLRCQSIDESGVRRWGAVGLSVGVEPGSREWRVLARGLSDGAGGVLVFWRNQRDPFTPPLLPMLMEGQRFAADGTRLWGATPRVVRTTGMESTNSHTFDFFQVASDGAGGAILAFDDWLGGSPQLDVVAQRVSPTGSQLWGEGATVAGASGQQEHGQTIAGPDGGAFVAVYEGVSATHSRLRLFRLGPHGSHLWAEEGLLLSAPGATALDYALDGSFDYGVLRLAWTHQLAPASSQFDVHFAAFTPRGRRFGGPGGIPLTTAPYGQFSRELAYSRAHGGILAVWDDLRKNDWNDTDVFGATLEDAPWLVPSALRVDTSLSGASDGNGVLEPGEAVSVTPAWLNTSATPVGPSVATASNFDGPAGATYTLVDSSADYGTIAGDSSQDCAVATGNCYAFEVSAPVVRPALHWDATFDETLSSGDLETWRLHVGGSFTDVPRTYPFYRFIEALLHKGVTQGCGPGTFCPASVVTRRQAAVFLLKAKLGSEYVARPATGIFSDVPVQDPFAPWIEDLFNRGITSGCGGGRFCPDASLTRGQIAVQLLRALTGKAYLPPAATGIFNDVPAAHPFAAWIEEIARRGITSGCGGGNYCPDNPVTRGEVAVFLTRGFGLELYGP